MGKAYRLGLVKQDDGGMPIVEYIVKYKTVSNVVFLKLNKRFIKSHTASDYSQERLGKLLVAWRKQNTQHH